MPTRAIVAVADTTERASIASSALANNQTAPLVFRRDSNTLDVYDIDSAAYLSIPLTASLTAIVAAVAAGYKLARGVHQQAAASDTIVTGLATVVAVVIAPVTITLKQLFFQASIGDQAGTPAAGSFLLTSKKPTAVNDVTPIAATDFTDNINVNWVAIGT